MTPTAGAVPANWQASSSSSSAAAAAVSTPTAAEEEELELPPGCVAWVVPSTPLKLYTSREALEARLRELGAAVVGKGAGLSKQEVTHIVVAEGTEAGAVPRSACPDATVVSERWVVRRARALKAGTIKAPAAEAVAAAAAERRARQAAARDAGDAAGGGRRREARGARAHGQRGGARAPRPRAVGAAVFD